jgi:putative ABC transport system permease protein
MIQLLIRSIVRLILKNKTLSFVKIIGLSLGTSVFLLASLFCIDELNFDRQHPGYQNIYRYVHNVNTPEGLQSFAFTSATTGPALLERFPEVKNFTRIIFPQVSVSNVGSDAVFYEGKFGFADPNFFSIFNFPLDHEGDPGVVLKHPLSVVLTPRSASRYFGSEDPIGKTLLISGELQFTVTGVLEQIPTDSHIDFDFIASFSSLEVIKNHPVVSQQIPASVNLDTKGFNAFYTYLLLAPGSNPANLESKFPQFIEEFRGKGKSERLKPTLQSLESIHLNSTLLYEIQPNGSSATVLVFLFVGVIIVGIACINYINISTAEFISRAPGTGLKKILGVTRTTLVVSHLAETAALAIFSVITGCAMYGVCCQVSILWLGVIFN